MIPIATQQVALDNALVALEKRIKIEKCNARIKFISRKSSGLDRVRPLRAQILWVIMEYLVKISKKACILELKRRNIKITDTDIQYAISVKKDMAYLEEFFMELKNNAYHRMFDEDVVDHIPKVLEMLDLISIPGVDYQLPHNEHEIEEGNELRQIKRKEDNKNNEKPNKKIWKYDVFMHMIRRILQIDTYLDTLYRKGHFAREYRSPKDSRRNEVAEPQRRKSDESWPPSSLYDRFQPSDGYHDVPPPYIGTFMPPKPDLVFNTAPTAVDTNHSAFTVQPSLTKPKQDLSHTDIPTTPIIRD
nr:hypothetical protein [Tanacetum cinerariifolium]